MLLILAYLDKIKSKVMILNKFEILIEPVDMASACKHLSLGCVVLLLEAGCCRKMGLDSGGCG